MSDPVKTTLSALQALGITVPESHTILEHPAAAKADEHLAVLAPHLESKPAFTGQLAKNLFIKDTKTKQLYLLMVHHRTNADWKAIAKLLGAKEVRQADAALMSEKIGVQPGSVTPLAVMNDRDNSVILVVEKALTVSDQPILVHPLINTATIALHYADIDKFATAHSHPIKIIDMSGIEATPATGTASAPKLKKAAAPAKKADLAPKQQAEKGKSQLGLDKRKHGEFALWYSQVVVRSELIEYYDISGCYILRPWSFAIWEAIQAWFDTSIKRLGVKNAYFPLFVSRAALEKEKDHVEGFAPEVAWVTKSGDTDLSEPIAVRPTSETIMYPAFAKWIRSHRDLPLKLNQWSNVVRWEFKFPTPFIRSREFLWQEGHTAFATKKEADEEVLQILDLYAGVYEKLLAVPVTKGKKTEMEKFAGGLYTTTVEAFIPATGRGIQGATSHCLGQNFARMNDITFEDENTAKRGDESDEKQPATGSAEEKKKKVNYVWQNSWGLTTRTIGVMVMIHSDDKGLVLPPRVAPTQCIVIPIYKKENKSAVIEQCHTLRKRLLIADIRADVDDRDNYNPGWKFNHWELKGVCLRLEMGADELKSQTVKIHRRDLDDKSKDVVVAWDALTTEIPAILTTMHNDMLEKARAEMFAKRKQVTEWRDFTRALDSRCTALAPHCEDRTCEKAIKQRTAEAAVDDEETQTDAVETGVEKLTGAAKSLCIPFEQPELTDGLRCIGCAEHAKNWTLFGRSY